MRTFRITLSHGNEHITFDGAGARSGSMFHVRRDAIEGLWSSPASKVSLTERETANGASPISDGETLYAARTVVIPFAIQSNYNHTDLIRARILLGRLIGWHDVRMDINDDGDETVLFGYVEAKYSNIPYDHTDTGTITLVCPDPRRVSKNASTVTMNTSSSSLGGLSFGTPAYDLAWTGTTNASASTLSRGGQVVATNYVPNPGFETGDLTGWNQYDTSAVVNIEQQGDIVPALSSGGKWQATIPDGGGVELPVPVAGAFHIGFMAYSANNGRSVSVVANGNVIKTFHPASDSWVRCDVDTPNLTPSMTLALVTSSPDSWPIRVDNVIMCTAADWSAMQARGIDWFSGDSQAPQPNAGLAFPLNFGQTGNMGNTGMIVNNGSYVSMPVITAHGWLDSGLTIHWNTSDGNEGDLSYKGSIQNVPVTINTDSHSAIMGGLGVSYQLGSRDWPRIPAGGSCSFALLASGNGWVTVQSHDTYM